MFRITFETKRIEHYDTEADNGENIHCLVAGDDAVLSYSGGCRRCDFTNRIDDADDDENKRTDDKYRRQIFTDDIDKARRPDCRREYDGKKMMENARSEILSVNGAILISKVVAAVRGGAMSTPVHKIMIIFNILPGILPSASSRAVILPPPSTIA